MASRARWAVVAVAALAVLAGAVGCDTDDGRELRPPPPGATAPPLPTSSTAPPAGGSASTGTTLVASAPFTVTSPSFAEGLAIPARHSCDGDDVSPALGWTGVPAGTVELAVVVTDPDAGGFVHWVVAGIDPTTVGLGEGGIPETAVEATNGFGTAGWRGPCPPPGSTHHYQFAVHALSAPSGVTPGEDGADAIVAIGTATAATATLTATYGRPG